MPTNDNFIAEVRARLETERAEVVDELEALRARLETKGDYELGEGDPMIYQWELNLALPRSRRATSGRNRPSP